MKRQSGAVRAISERRRAPRPTDPNEIAALVDRLAREVDWNAALPPHADSSGWRFSQDLKRLLDIAVSAAALLVLSPLLILVAILVRLDSRGPSFYSWTAVGYRGRRFTEYKFRTMVSDAARVEDDLRHLNEMDGPVFKIRNDPRITRFGRFLRKFSIDELPQLWNVLVGDMSLVGPRPLIWHEFADATPEQRRKLSVIPGLTCFWQISGRSAITSFQEWVDLDLAYIRDWSFRLDLEIMLKTVPVVLRGRNAY